MRKAQNEPLLNDRMTVGEAAYTVLHRDFERFATFRQGVLATEDPEAVHEMRVANRRLRAALKIFRLFLSDHLISLEPDLDWIFAKLGAVRDLDIEIEKLAGWKTASKKERDGVCLLSKRLVAERSRAKGNLTRALSSERFKLLLSSLDSAIALGPPSKRGLTSVPILAVAPDLVIRRYRKSKRRACRLTENSPSPEFHDLRKKAKKLRYSLDFFKDLYGSQADAMIKRLKELQDLLGSRQDDVVAENHLKQLAGKDGLPDEAQKLAERIIKAYAEEASAYQEQFEKTGRGALHKEWKGLSKEMRRRRRALWGS